MQLGNGSRRSHDCLLFHLLSGVLFTNEQFFLIEKSRLFVNTVYKPRINELSTNTACGTCGYSQ